MRRALQEFSWISTYSTGGMEDLSDFHSIGLLLSSVMRSSHSDELGEGPYEDMWRPRAL